MKGIQLFILGAAACLTAPSCSNEFRQLDYALAHSDEYDLAFQQKQDSLYAAFAAAPDDSMKFETALALQKNYFFHNADSCYKYARTMEAFSGESTAARALSRVCLSRILIRLDSLDKARSLLQDVTGGDIPADELHVYYFTKINLMKKLDRTDTASVNALLKEWRLADNQHADCFYLSRKRGFDAESLAALQKIVANPVSRNEYAKANYGLGMIYLEIGNEEEAVRYLAESAKSDMEISVKGYGALHELAKQLMRRGDVKKAVRYIRRTRRDAQEYNYASQFRNINEMEVETLNMLLTQETRQKQILFITTPAIAVLLLLTLSVLMKLSRSQKKLEEVSSIKDCFLTTYMERCVDYLDKVDEYRSELRHTAKQSGPVAVLALLRKPSFADSEFHRLLENFDAAFLGIFPDFVQRLNAVTKPQFRYSLEEDGSMTTSLRILALIRLGITERKKIAKILNMSVATVYSYHTHLQQNSTCSREEFDSVVKGL